MTHNQTHNTSDMRDSIKHTPDLRNQSTSKKQIDILRSGSILVLLMFVILISSCGRRAHFQKSAVVPAADGKAKFRQDNNNNYRVKVNVKHLAGAPSLPQPRSVYVVWMETERNGVQNLGQLTTNNRLRGSLTAVTPYRPMRIFITGEPAANVQYPGTYVVLATTPFRGSMRRAVRGY